MSKAPSGDRRREEDAARNSVFNEPGAIFPEGSPARRRGVIDRDWSCEACGYNLRGLDADQACPECAHRQIAVPSHVRGGYGKLLAERAAQPRPAWIVPLLCLLPGMLAIPTVPLIFGMAFMPEGFSRVVLVPIATAFMVIGPLVMTVERKPWLLRSAAEILFIAGTAAAAFAAVEHALHILLLSPGMEPAGIVIRATVGMAVPIGCMLYAASALAQVWQRAMQEGREPDLAPFYPRFMIAITAYALYKLAMIAIGMAGYVL